MACIFLGGKKMSYKRKDIIEYETFDYYSIKPKDINELFNKDIDLFRNLLINKSLYALCFMKLFDEAIDNKGIWYYYKMPNDDPVLDFKYEIDFKNIISEYKIPKGEYSLHYGISKISIDDYIKHYKFYNDINDNFLIIADENDISKIDSVINELVHDLLNYEKNIEINPDFFKAFEKSNLNSICTIIKSIDDEEFKIIKILYKNDN